MIQHVVSSHPGIKHLSYGDEVAPMCLDGIDVSLGLLSWNCGEIAPFSARSLIAELNKLTTLGATARVIWVDNGSTDATRAQIRMELNRHTANSRRIENAGNLGQSVGRNQMIDRAKQHNSKYLFMMDADILAVPWSVAAMVEYAETYGDKHFGCIGAYSGNYTADTSSLDVLKCARLITGSTIQQTPNIAWTQYGLFSLAMFSAGVRFDESKCFCGPGWGLEDDDLWLQMQDKGYTSVNAHMRHVHKRNTSLRALDPTLAAKVFDSRKSFVLNKWGQKAAHLASVSMPLTPSTKP